MNSFRAILTKESHLISRTMKRRIVGLCTFSVIFPFIVDYFFPGGALFELLFVIPSLLMAVELITSSMIKENENKMLELLLCQDMNKMAVIFGKLIAPLLYGSLTLAISLIVNVLLIPLPVEAIPMAAVTGILIISFAIFVSIFLSLFKLRREHYYFLNGLLIYLTCNTVLIFFIANRTRLLLIFIALIILFLTLCFVRLSALDTNLHFCEKD